MNYILDDFIAERQRILNFMHPRWHNYIWKFIFAVVQYWQKIHVSFQAPQKLDIHHQERRWCCEIDSCSLAGSLCLYSCIKYTSRYVYFIFIHRIAQHSLFYFDVSEGFSDVWFSFLAFVFLPACMQIFTWKLISMREILILKLKVYLQNFS